MARGLGKNDDAAEYSRLAKDMAAKWQQMAIDGDHYKLAFDSPEPGARNTTSSGTGFWASIFSRPSVRQTEIAFYLKHLNHFGLPLDNRKDYTKLDWEIWTATLADRPEDWSALLEPIGRWVNEGPPGCRSPTGTTPKPANRRASRPARWWEAFTSRCWLTNHWPRNGANTLKNDVLFAFHVQTFKSP